jgi:hypothetical protein
VPRLPGWRGSRAAERATVDNYGVLQAVEEKTGLPA